MATSVAMKKKSLAGSTAAYYACIALAVGIAKLFRARGSEGRGNQQQKSLGTLLTLYFPAVLGLARGAHPEALCHVSRTLGELRCAESWGSRGRWLISLARDGCSECEVTISRQLDWLAWGQVGPTRRVGAICVIFQKEVRGSGVRQRPRAALGQARSSNVCRLLHQGTDSRRREIVEVKLLIACTMPLTACEIAKLRPLRSLVGARI